MGKALPSRALHTGCQSCAHEQPPRHTRGSASTAPSSSTAATLRPAAVVVDRTPVPELNGDAESGVAGAGPNKSQALGSTRFAAQAVRGSDRPAPRQNDTSGLLVAAAADARAPPEAAASPGGGGGEGSAVAATSSCRCQQPRTAAESRWHSARAATALAAVGSAAVARLGVRLAVAAADSSVAARRASTGVQELSRRSAASAAGSFALLALLLALLGGAGSGAPQAPSAGVTADTSPHTHELQRACRSTWGGA